MTSPGRLEIVRRSPTVLVDAAHNPHGARSLVAALGEAFAFTRLVGLVGIVADKDAAGMLEVLEPALDHIVDHPQLVAARDAPEALGALAVEIFGESRVTVVRDLPDALEQAVTLAEADGMGGGVIATGSVITAGEVRMLLGRRRDRLDRRPSTRPPDLGWPHAPPGEARPHRHRSSWSSSSCGAGHGTQGPRPRARRPHRRACGPR